MGPAFATKRPARLTRLIFTPKGLGHILKLHLTNDFRVERRDIPDLAMTLELPIMPPSTNNLYFNVPGSGRVKSQKYRDWLKSAGLILARQITGRMSGRVDIRFFLEDAYPTRDASNTIKPLEDLLVAMGVIHDDRSKFVRSVKAEWAPIKGVRIEIQRVAA